MKYGLIYYRDTDNIGDDILSYAAKRFLPRVDYYIDREEMDVFVPEETEPVAAILNGWYLHYNYTFPPSSYIIPLFVGTHFGRDQMIFGDYSFLDGNASKYLQMNEPIGCRDTNTLSVMKEKGIDSYFSGCLTLTLQPFEDVTKTCAVILTDVSQEVETYVGNLLPNQDMIYKTHIIPKEDRGEVWDIREKRVKEILRLYQGAQLVITTRLHCALPAIALGTPVILVGKFDEDFYDRIADYAGYCRCFDTKDILTGKADDIIRHPIPNQNIEEIRGELVKACEGFIGRMEETEQIDLPERRRYTDLYVERTVYMRRVIQRLLEERAILENQCGQDRENLNKLLSISQTLFWENERLQRELEQK